MHIISNLLLLHMLHTDLCQVIVIKHSNNKGQKTDGALGLY